MESHRIFQTTGTETKEEKASGTAKISMDRLSDM
jgi:hypothetical protein